MELANLYTVFFSSLVWGTVGVQILLLVLQIVALRAGRYNEAISLLGANILVMCLGQVIKNFIL